MVQEKFDLLIAEAQRLRDTEGYDAALTILEEAHLLAQAQGWEHLLVHIEMFKLALHYRVLKEALGQIPRMILAAPGSALGIFPVGNVGSTKMGLFEKGESDTIHR